DTLVCVCGRRVEAGRGVRGCRARQVRRTLAELAGVAADPDRNGLGRVDADPSFEVDRVRASRQRLEPGAVDRRGRVADQTVAERPADVHAPFGRGSEPGAIDQRIFDEAIAVEALDIWRPGEVRLADA